MARVLPKDRANDILVKQVIRSAASVGANIAEGFGRYKGKEYERFLQVALGSANETEYWLMILAEINPRFSFKIKEIMKINSESIKVLAKSLQTLRKS